MGNDDLQAISELRAAIDRAGPSPADTRCIDDFFQENPRSERWWAACRQEQGLPQRREAVTRRARDVALGEADDLAQCVARGEVPDEWARAFAAGDVT